MRIISGKLKGRRLNTPADQRIRPTTDKVKEAVFSMINGWIDEDSVCIDLFSGTGNLGLEALSRGADKCYFCDNSRIHFGTLSISSRHSKRVRQDLVTKQLDMIIVANVYLAGQALTMLNISHGLFHFILAMTLRRSYYHSHLQIRKLRLREFKY